MAPVRLAFDCLPYLTLLAFLYGTARRFRRWQRAPAPAAPLFPCPSPGPAVWRRMAFEICLLRGRRPVSVWSGLFPWLLHVALAGIAIGHIRAFTDFPRLWAALALTPQAVDRFAATAGIAVGLLGLGAALVLLGRRLLVPRLRQITHGDDVFALLLLLAVLASGMAMRLGPQVDLTPVRDYFAALAGLHPRPMPEVPGFAPHFLLAQALAVYAPFGKLLHIAGAFPAKLGTYEDAAPDLAGNAPATKSR